MTKDEQNNLLDAVAGVCLWCFVLSMCLLLLWFVFYLGAGNWVYSVHSRFFDITRHEFEVVGYCGAGLVKIAAFLFFLFPYVAIKLILRKK
jgi:hypothetical protein